MHIRLLTSLMLCALTVLSAGAEIIRHVVGRGESIEEVAELYGVTVDEIRQANYGIEKCFMGLELSVPVSKNPVEMEIQLLNTRNGLYRQAQDHIANGKLKEAVKAYDQIKINGGTPIAVCYDRGKIQYQRDRLDESIKDLTYVVRNDSLDLFPDAEELLIEVKQEKRRREIERMMQMSAFANIATSFIPGGSSLTDGLVKNAIARTATRTVVNSMTRRAMESSEKDKPVESPKKKAERTSSQQSKDLSMEAYARFVTENKKPDGTNYSYEEWRSLMSQMTGSDQEDGEESLGSNEGEAAVTTALLPLRENCKHCKGTGRVERNTAVPASLGLSGMKVCEECGKEYDSAVTMHYHISCSECQ